MQLGARDSAQLGNGVCGRARLAIGPPGGHRVERVRDRHDTGLDRDLLDYLNKHLVNRYPTKAPPVPVDEWITKPGVPASAPKPTSPAFGKVEAEAQRWLRGEIPAAGIASARWTTQEWLHFLKSLPENLDRTKMEELDKAFQLTSSGNSEVAFQWLVMAIRNRYEPANAKLEEFLMTIGRRKFIKPLYEELAKTPEGKERALAIYRRARASYHPIAVTSIDEVLKWSGQ